MRHVLRLFLCLVAAFLTSCVSELPTPDRSPFPTDGRIPDDLEIELQRSQCYGTCPAYEVHVDADGAVTFNGWEYTETEGGAEGQINEAKVRKLIEEFDEADFFDFEDEYKPKTGSDCATDSSTVTTTIRINGRDKTVAHYLGCDAPDELTHLEHEVDEILGTERWIGNP